MQNRNITPIHTGAIGIRDGLAQECARMGKEQGHYLKAILKVGEEPINNIQPSRIVKFIRFVGF